MTERCLVTGGAGFIGSHTVDHLLEKGYQVRVLDNLQPRVHPQGKPGWLTNDAEFIQGDVADKDTMERCLDGMDYVLHLAAYQDYMNDFSNFIRANSMSSALIFELIVQKQLPVKKIVFASSQSVCGEGCYECEEHGLIVPKPRPIEQLERGDWEIHCPQCDAYMKSCPIDEDVTAPGTTYAISKYTIELLADRLGRRYGIPTSCMRYTYVQGPRNSFYNAYSGIARIFAMRIMHGLPPICYEDGQQLRDYVNVRDIARANVLVMEEERADHEVFNAGGGRGITVLQFAELMLKEFGSDLEPSVPGIFRLGDTRHTVSKVDKIKSLGWEPEIPVEQNVREYVAWIREQEVSEEYVREAERIMSEEGVLRQAATVA